MKRLSLTQPLGARALLVALTASASVLTIECRPAGAQAPAPPPAPLSAGAPAPDRARVPGRADRSGVVVAARPYIVQIRTRDGRYLTLRLRNGTVINPLGTTLTPGMPIAFDGARRSDGAFETDRIDLQPPMRPRQRGPRFAPGQPGPDPRNAPPGAGAPPPPPGAGAPPPPAPPSR